MVKNHLKITRAFMSKNETFLVDFQTVWKKEWLTKKALLQLWFIWLLPPTLSLAHLSSFAVLAFLCLFWLVIVYRLLLQQWSKNMLLRSPFLDMKFLMHFAERFFPQRQNWKLLVTVNLKTLLKHAFFPSRKLKPLKRNSGCFLIDSLLESFFLYTGFA